MGIGYTYQRALYSGSRERSGPRYAIPSTNAIGTPADELGIPDFAVGQQFNVQFRLSVELNKRFSNNWQLLSNFRIASLRGNYEGHLRNDNGQTDPGISSLFDFTAGEFNLLGDQFRIGPLNTDRRFVSNIYASYGFGDNRSGFNWRFLQGLNLGVGFHMESGIPISEFSAASGLPECR